MRFIKPMSIGGHGMPCSYHNIRLAIKRFHFLLPQHIVHSTQDRQGDEIGGDADRRQSDNSQPSRSAASPNTALQIVATVVTAAESRARRRNTARSARC
jgi:hypothetical protein